MRVIEKSKSARVDLLGGTLDLPPINLILGKVVTLNAALSLKSHIKISSTEFEGVEIHSKDYRNIQKIPFREWTTENLYETKAFRELTFVTQIIDQFNPIRSKGPGLKVEMSSDIPAGSGLGGSSVMGITLYEALVEWYGIKSSREETLAQVQAIEARVLDCGPTGYQDYYPALYGGVLALFPHAGKIQVEQLFSEELKNYLESHLTLVYSGQTRFSGMNNWEVYKAFFDKKESVRKGLGKLAEVSHKAYLAIKAGHFDSLWDLISAEGSHRQELFSQITTQDMLDLFLKLQRQIPRLGMKVCGAGGGGCFILIHGPEDRAKILKELSSGSPSPMSALPFQISQPLA